MTLELTWSVEGNRVEYRFGGVQISSGPVADLEKGSSIEVIRAMRRHLAANGMITTDNFKLAMEYWRNRRRV